MATEIKLPVLGENVDSGTVAKILVSPGDTIEQDQAVLDLDTEKASVEVPASASGTVKEIRVKEGETIKVGQVILTLEGGEETKEEAGRKSEAGSPEEKKAAPSEPETKEEGTGLEEEPPEQKRTSRTPARSREKRPKHGEEEEPAPTRQKGAEQAGPSLEEITPEEKEEARPARDEKSEPSGKEERQPAPGASRELAPAAPSLRRMARELGVDINEVTGTGPGGRIAEADVRNYARSIILNATGPREAVLPEPSAPPDFSRWGEIERKAMSGVRRKTAGHLQEAWSSIPHVTHFDSADITELEQLRQRYARKVEEAGGKLSVTAIALKVAAAALKVFPQFNASLDTEQEEIIYKKYCHIGVAVDTDRGLLVPVIRDVDRKNILDLSVELSQMAEKARNKKLTIEEMQGGSFTITNLGGIGGSGFTPIINSPEVAILGISRASQQPVFVEGQFKPRMMLPLALSYDHRLIDGADAARFLRWVVEALQETFVLSLEG